MGRPGILLADDHTLVLEAFKKLLEPEFEIVGIVMVSSMVSCWDFAAARGLLRPRYR